MKALLAKLFRNDQSSRRFELYAKLSRRFNSYFEIQREYFNLHTGQRQGLVFISPYMDFYKEGAPETCRIAFWNLDSRRRRRLQSEARYVEYFGDKPADRIFLPQEHLESYPELLQIMGAPDGILNGLLTSSGRSVWICSEAEPICLKFDTTQLKSSGPYSERLLTEAGLWHSSHIAKELECEQNIFIESEGLSITFNRDYSAGEPLRLTFMIRRPPDSSDFEVEDNLVPLASFFSTRLWDEPQLCRALSLPDDKDKALNQLAHLLGDLLANSLLRTSIHFEVHQQNLNLQIGAGDIKKIICQDLQDTMLDPVTCFENANPVTPAEFEKAYQRIFELQRLTHFNSQGELIKHDGWLREALTISAFYRRYLSNIGHINESAAVLQNQDDFMSKDLEQRILRHLKAAIPLSSEATAVQEPEAMSVLNRDLYWYIDRIVADTHGRCARRYFKNAEQSNCRRVTSEYMVNAMLTFKTIVSADFPIHIKKIEPGGFEEIYDLFDNRIFVARYKNRYVLIIVLKYINSILQLTEA